MKIFQLAILALLGSMTYTQNLSTQAPATTSTAPSTTSAD